MCEVAIDASANAGPVSQQTMNRLMTTEHIENLRGRRGIAPSAYSRDAVGYYHDSRDVLSREQRRQMDEESKVRE